MSSDPQVPKFETAGGIERRLDQAKINAELQMSLRDPLREILAMQKKFMALLNHDKIPQHTETQMEVMAVALADEAFEILRELNWKPWKKPKSVDYPKLKEEVIDALHFVMEMCVLLHMSDHDILNAYTTKMTENINRQIKGY